MKTSKQQKPKGGQTSGHCNGNKSPTGVKKSLKSSGGHYHKNAGRGSSSKTLSDIKENEERKTQPSAKMKLQFFPLDGRTRKGLEKDGHYPFLELSLSARKKLSSVFERLCNKWGHSSVATGDLTLFPYSTSKDNLSLCKKWTSSESGISAGDVYAAVGSPDIFRLRYGWVSKQNKSVSSTPLCNPEPGHLERVSCGTMETTYGTKIETVVKGLKSQPSNSNEVANMAGEQKPSTEPSLAVHMNQAEGSGMQNELSFPSSLWSDMSNISFGSLLSDASLQRIFNNQDTKNISIGSLLSEASSQGFFNNQDTKNISIGGLLSEASLQGFFNNQDTKNISIGGLLSEASLQGLFNNQDTKNLSIGGLLSEVSLQGLFNTQDTKGGSKLASQPNAVVSDSLDAFMDQLKNPQALQNQSSDMRLSILDAENACHPPDRISSILDAENTCHSFQCSNPSSSKKDFPTPGRIAFSELSNQAIAYRSYKHPMSEVNAKDDVAGNKTAGEPNTDPDPLPCSVGNYNNENSLGFSSIRWNDSLGPFDIPITSRQNVKDDTNSIG